LNLGGEPWRLAFATAYGWRAAFWVAGVPGLIIAGVILATLREPTRGATDTAATPIRAADAPLVLIALAHIRNDRPLLHVTIAITVSAFVFASLWIWCSSILIRFHHFTLPEAGRIVALGGLFQATGSWLGGVVAAQLGKKSAANFGLVAAGSALLTVPLGVGFALSSSSVGAIVGICGMSLFNGGWQGPGFGLAVTMAPPRIRGVVMAFIQLFVNLVGVGVGPFLTGALSDGLGGALQVALALTFSLNLWAALHYVLATRAVRSTPARGSLSVGV
jgi:predicted MFS family arabinose efflux permease